MEIGSFPSFCCHDGHTWENVATLQWLAHTAIFSTIHEFLEGRNLTFPWDSELHESKHHGCSWISLNAPSPAQPWQIAEFKALDLLPPYPSMVFAQVFPRLISVIPLPCSPALNSLLLVTLQRFITPPSVSLGSKWHHVSLSYLFTCVLLIFFSAPTRNSVRSGRISAMFIIYLQNLEKCPVYKYLQNEWIC